LNCTNRVQRGWLAHCSSAHIEQSWPAYRVWSQRRRVQGCPLCGKRWLGLGVLRRTKRRKAQQAGWGWWEKLGEGMGLQSTPRAVQGSASAFGFRSAITSTRGHEMLVMVPRCPPSSLERTNAPHAHGTLGSRWDHTSVSCPVQCRYIVWPENFVEGWVRAENRSKRVTNEHPTA
jgi:hypothetical protein